MKTKELDNFFSGVEQTDISLEDEIIKLPVFYRKARAFMATFPASIFSLKRLLPDPRFTPAQVFPGMGLVALAAFEYYDTDIHAYNEFSISIMLNNPHMLKMPGYNILMQLLEFNLYTYILHLPVTTEIALRGGIDLYNYPKFLASIDFSDTEERIICDLKEEGDRILRITGKKIPAEKSVIMKFFCHLYQFGQPQYAEFKVNAIKYGISINPRDVKLEFGSSHPLAMELSDALLSRTALTCFYIPEMQAILYGPEYLPIPLIKSVLLRSPDLLVKK